MLVPCSVDSVRMHEETKQHVVLLKHDETGRVLPIWVGPDSAHAISLPLHGKTSERPLTHDFMRDVLARLGVRVTRVVVRSLTPPTGGDPKIGVFLASAFLGSPAGEIEVDCRPSDAIALALRAGAPIFVASEIFDPNSHLPPATN